MTTREKAIATYLTRNQVERNIERAQRKNDAQKVFDELSLHIEGLTLRDIYIEACGHTFIPVLEKYKGNLCYQCYLHFPGYEQQIDSITSLGRFLVWFDEQFK